MSRENVDVVRRLYEANARQDLKAIYELYDPDIQWDDVSGLWGDWGSRRGREAVREAFTSWFEAFEDVSYEAEDYLDAGEHVVVTTHMCARGRGSGLAVDQHITMVWGVRDGRVATVRAYRERAEALESIGLTPS